jgi:hypothetical protein
MYNYFIILVTLPNCGIDEPVVYSIFAPFVAVMGSNNNMLGNTRYVPDMYDTTIIHCYTDNNWSFTYNEYELFETLTFEGNTRPSVLIKYKQICDIITTPNIEFTEQILIYPNPAKEVINFNYEVKVEIYDLLGKTLLKTEIPVKYINISSLKAGLYFIKLNNNKIEKFIKE